MIKYNTLLEEPSEYLNGNIIHDFIEFSNLPFKAVEDFIVNQKKFNTIDYNSRKSTNDFYEKSKTYIFDLLEANWNVFKTSNKVNLFIPGIFDMIKNHPGDSFLEFGGGLGVLCQIVKDYTDKNVTYADVDGYISEFAMWRYEKYKIDIETVLIPQNDFQFDKKFDIVYTDAVWEHFSPKKQIDYLYKIDKYINNNGMLILIVDLAGEEKDMPMHYNVDIHNIHNTLKNIGYINSYGDGYFASVWNKKLI